MKSGMDVLREMIKGATESGHAAAEYRFSKYRLLLEINGIVQFWFLESANPYSTDDGRAITADEAMSMLDDYLL